MPMKKYFEDSLCEFEPCGRPAITLDLCITHYRMARDGKPLRPIESRRPYRAALVRDTQGRKQCNNCEAWLPEASFYKNNKALDGLSPPCRDCTRKTQIRNSYGISWDQYEGLLNEQNGVCAICRTRGDGRRLAVDHDHACCPGKRSCGACVRGLLCSACNPGLGYFRDNRSLLLEAVAYLDRYSP